VEWKKAKCDKKRIVNFENPAWDVYSKKIQNLMKPKITIKRNSE